MEIKKQYWLLCFPILTSIILFITERKCRLLNQKNVLRNIRIHTYIALLFVIVVLILMSYILRMITGIEHIREIMVCFAIILAHGYFVFIGVYALKIQELLEKSDNDILIGKIRPWNI